MSEPTIDHDEIASEIAHLDLVARETQIVRAAEAKAKALRLASIATTLPQDWVKHKTPDGDVFAYLQDSGCQRVANLWGIRFDKTSLRDFVREDLPDENVRFEVMVTGRSLRTDLERTEIGARTTAGFFAKAWEKAKASGDHAQMALVLDNVKKSALTNAHGRVVRALTGLGRMPEEELRTVMGDRAGKSGNVSYERGASGGRAIAGAASEGQLKRIAGLACMEGIVQGCERANYSTVLAGLNTCRPPLTKQKASAVMEWLEKRSAEDDRPTKDEFKAEVGWPDAAPAKSEGEDGTA